MGPSEPVHKSRVFRVMLRSSAWDVSRNGTFFGDYLRRGMTHSSAAEKREAHGRPGV